MLVRPEYNFGPSPALLNALDSLYLEWNYMPAGVIAYGVQVAASRVDGPGGDDRDGAEDDAAAGKRRPVQRLRLRSKMGCSRPRTPIARPVTACSPNSALGGALRPLRADHRETMLPPL